MPYIKEGQRKKLDPVLEQLFEALNVSDENTSKGEYNYVITKILHNYIFNFGLRYHNLNDAIGIVEAAKAEFIRKVVSPYENIKIKDNGDINDMDSLK